MHLCMKSNCIVNTFSFPFHLYPFCYFLFPCPDFHSFTLSHFSSILISCHFIITIFFSSDFGNIYIFLLNIPVLYSLCLSPLNDHILYPVFPFLAQIHSRAEVSPSLATSSDVWSIQSYVVFKEKSHRCIYQFPSCSRQPILWGQHYHE